jgi:hypothetical protein
VVRLHRLAVVILLRSERLVDAFTAKGTKLVEGKLAVVEASEQGPVTVVGAPFSSHKNIVDGGSVVT